MLLQESLRERTQSLRKHVQENESLEFRNQQLSKRVALLQEEISSPTKKKKKVCIWVAGYPGLSHMLYIIVRYQDQGIYRL